MSVFQAWEKNGQREVKGKFVTRVSPWLSRARGLLGMHSLVCSPETWSCVQSLNPNLRSSSDWPQAGSWTVPFLVWVSVSSPVKWGPPRNGHNQTLVVTVSYHDLFREQLIWPHPAELKMKPNLRPTSSTWWFLPWGKPRVCAGLSTAASTIMTSDWKQPSFQTREGRVSKV